MTSKTLCSPFLDVVTNNFEFQWVYNGLECSNELSGRQMEFLNFEVLFMKFLEKDPWNSPVIVVMLIRGVSLLRSFKDLIKWTINFVHCSAHIKSVLLNLENHPTVSTIWTFSEHFGKKLICVHNALYKFILNTKPY